VGRIDISVLAPPAQRVLAEGSPLPARVLAARGILPGCPLPDVLAVVVCLAAAVDPEVSRTARATLDALPRPLLQGAIRSELQGPVIAELVGPFGNDLEILPRLLQMRALDGESLGRLAERATEEAGEMIATNEQLILAFPATIEKLYMNVRVRMSTSDRLIDLAVRNGIELDFPAFKLAAQAIQDQLIPEPAPEPTFDDRLFGDATELAEKLRLESEEDDVCEADEEGVEALKQRFVPLFMQVQEMTVTQKIRSATLGNATMRMLLVRDTNRLVSEAAAKSPRLTENEGVRIAASRAVSDDVLRIVAMNRELTRSYQVKLNLVTNPRTPFSFASRLLPHIRTNDLRSIARSKNVPGAVSRLAIQQLNRQK
jgi:hypothetical protein